MTDEELAAIVDEYRHDDRSHMGEVLTALATERVLRKKAEDRLAGYQSAATVFKGRFRKTVQILIEAVGADGSMDAEAVAVRAVEEIARIRARLSKCKFCGQDAAEGAGGHTSGCYERKLNKVRAALEIDDCTAMTDAIEEALNE
jgi:hypothetical protein